MGIDVEAGSIVHSVVDGFVEQLSTSLTFKTIIYKSTVVNPLGLQLNQSKLPFSLFFGSL